MVLYTTMKFKLTDMQVQQLQPTTLQRVFPSCLVWSFYFKLCRPQPNLYEQLDVPSQPSAAYELRRQVDAIVTTCPIWLLLGEFTMFYQAVCEDSTWPGDEAMSVPLHSKRNHSTTVSVFGLPISAFCL